MAERLLWAPQGKSHLKGLLDLLVELRAEILCGFTRRLSGLCGTSACAVLGFAGVLSPGRLIGWGVCPAEEGIRRGIGLMRSETLAADGQSQSVNDVGSA